MAFCMDCQKSTYFYPRSPCGERLSLALDQYLKEQISIHALLAESDLRVLDGSKSSIDFYPRSPCGERQAEHQ